MIPNLRTLYDPRRLTTTLVYMLQNVEYDPLPYLRWFWRTSDFSCVMYRRTLDRTKPARLLRLFLFGGVLLQIIMGLLVIGLWRWDNFPAGGFVGLALLISYPVVWAHVITLPLILARELWVKPQQNRQIAAAGDIFTRHPGTKIAIAGSYGKTSMKELLVTVLGEGKRVAATPANKNVAVSHAQFAQQLQGDEEVLIIEYGEGRPGDVQAFVEMTRPTHGVITGLAPAHLDAYKTVQAAGKDIFSLADYLHGRHVYVNAESAAIQPFLKKSYGTYSAAGVLSWEVSNIRVGLEGTRFTLTKGKQKLNARSGLLGRHNVGPLSLAIALGLELGLSAQQVEAGIAQTMPFEHRMQPYILGGAWIIDDTYNGNLEGIRAGTALLAELSAKRKFYVTPGLVDQGKETRSVHEAMGRLIARAKPDVVVLMDNSVTSYIQTGLRDEKFKGEIRVEDHPLEFYQNLNQFVAAGDLLMLQNDWTDNYY